MYVYMYTYEYSYSWHLAPVPVAHDGEAAGAARSLAAGHERVSMYI